MGPKLDSDSPLPGEILGTDFLDFILILAELGTESSPDEGGFLHPLLVHRHNGAKPRSDQSSIIRPHPRGVHLQRKSLFQLHQFG